MAFISESPKHHFSFFNGSLWRRDKKEFSVITRDKLYPHQYSKRQLGLVWEVSVCKLQYQLFLNMSTKNTMGKNLSEQYFKNSKEFFSRTFISNKHPKRINSKEAFNQNQ